ncbi:hypothetical protein KQH50_02610 [bacterium]|nr:hypothetical protein [bacterium]
MGKKKISRTSVLLLTVIVIIFQAGCSTGKIAFQEGEHAANEAYPETFTVHTASAPQFNLHIQEPIYDYDSGVALLEQISLDIETLSAQFELDRTLDIYIVEETPTEAAIAVENMIYCSPEDVTEGAYREALVKAYTGLQLPWKLAGAYAVSFGEAVDMDALADYFSAPDNFGMLSLFDAYFMEAFADRETLALAIDTAGAFTDFLLTEYGPETFLQPVGPNEYRQEFLDSLGMSVAYAPKYDLTMLDEAQISSSEDYALIVTTPDRVFSFADNVAESPEPILETLAYYPTGMENVLRYIETNAPDYYAEIEPVLDEPFYYYFDGDLIGVRLDTSKRSLYLAAPSITSQFLETFWYLVPEAQGETQIWKRYGLGLYLLSVADVPISNYYAFFQVLPEELTGDSAIYMGMVQDYYLDHAAYPEKLTDFDFGLLFEALAMGLLRNPDLDLYYPRMSTMTIAETTREERNYLRYPGNDLTTPEAYLFTEYLVETYGLDKMIAYCTTYATLAFQNTFGLSYDEAFDDFQAAYDIVP